MARARFAKYVNPVMTALRELGGSARPDEVSEIVSRKLALPDSTLDEVNPSGVPRFYNDVAWARFYLAKDGFIDSSRHGVWTLTEKGRTASEFSEQQLNELIRRVQASSARSQVATTSAPISAEPAPTADEQPPDSEGDYREELAALLKALPPDGFERLCQRLLRESGFEQVSVTGKSGDGGIDGIGILQVNPLVSFKVLFQCKRFAGSVGPSVVRDFRGAMQGRAEKGIIITTGTFSADARREAAREGVPPIELVDGSRLLEIFEQRELGLKPRTTYDLDREFFKNYR
jgi:restriction system protein